MIFDLRYLYFFKGFVRRDEGFVRRNYKPSPRILRQHRVLRNLRKNKDIVITKPDKGNGVVILDRKLYDNAIQELISDTSKFDKLNEDPTLKREASL